MSQYFDVQLTMAGLDGPREVNLYLPPHDQPTGHYHQMTLEEAKRLGVALLTMAGRAEQINKEAAAERIRANIEWSTNASLPVRREETP